MLAAGINTSTLPFNGFDIAIVALLIFAFWRGRRRGMTKELLPTLQWLTILLVAGFGHIFIGAWLEQQGYAKQVFAGSFKVHTAALVTGYLAITFVIFIVFTMLKRKFNPRLEGSNFFGGNEYYWGIVAGLVRYTCLILVALAVLNAPYYTAGDIAATKVYNNRWFGGGMQGYSGNFIPTVYEVQDYVFKQSFAGPYIKDNLSPLLIVTTPGSAHARS
jgi:hypothetical protein